MDKSKEFLKNVIFRPLRKDDAEEMWRYINKLSQEDTFVRFSGEKISLEEEAEYVEQSLKKIKTNDLVLIIAERQGKIVGIGAVERDFSAKKRNLHRGILGLSVERDYRGQGIGKKLLDILISEAKKNITNLKLITLHVFENNLQASELYKNAGFVEYGRLPNGILFRGNYTGEIGMYKQIK